MLDSADADMLKRLYPYWRPAAGATAMGMALILITSLLELALPWPIKWLVDSVFGDEPAPRWLAAFLAAGKGNAIAAICVAILLLGLAHKAVQLASHYLLIRAGLRLVRNLRCHVVDHLHHLPLSYHDKQKVGDSIYRAAYDSYAAQSLLSQVVAPVATGLFVLVGILVVMLRLDVTLTLIALVTAPLLGLQIFGFGRAIEHSSRRYHEQESGLFSLLQETLTSIRAIQAFTAEPVIAERFNRTASRSERLNRRLSLVQLAFGAGVGLVTAAATALAVYVGAHRVLQGRLSLGEVLLFISYLGMLYTPVSNFAHSAAAARAARTQLDRVFDILDTAGDLINHPHALTLPSIRGHIEFSNVSFAYEPDRPVLSNVHLQIEPGATTALVGRTGSGKTTIASLLLRFYDPTAGAILLDGHDVRQLRLSWLRRQVSVVLQDAILFSGTVAENIALGSSDASDAQVVAAATQAQADEFIRALPMGYNTLLGERGVNLSGGQRQRISIARAFLKNAPILILDEPTSALDAQTEASLIEALHQLMQGRTTIVIAHRLSTIRRTDQVVVLEAGRVIERGSHDQLLASGGRYATLYQTQWGATAGAGASP